MIKNRQAKEKFKGITTFRGISIKDSDSLMRESLISTNQYLKKIYTMFSLMADGLDVPEELWIPRENINILFPHSLGTEKVDPGDFGCFC
jgi:hypothetical protein